MSEDQRVQTAPEAHGGGEREGTSRGSCTADEVRPREVVAMDQGPEGCCED